MAAVYVNNLVINSGSDFSQSFNLEGSDNSPLNLTGYQVDAQMRKWSGSSVAITFTTTSEDYNEQTGSGCIIENAHFSPSTDEYGNTRSISTDSLGIKNRVIEGMVLVREGVTR